MYLHSLLNSVNIILLQVLGVAVVGAVHGRSGAAY
jgi:hypothetical protein